MNHMTAKILLALITSVAVQAHAQSEPAADSSPYFYSGPCSSQGSWTHAALSQASELKQVINNIKNNPACNALKANIQSGLDALDLNIKEIQNIDKTSSDKTRRLSQLPQEISALRTFSRGSSLFKDNVAQLLMGKSVTLSALSSQTVDRQGDPNTTATSISSLGERAKASTQSGLQLFNSTMQVIQDAQANCLDSVQGPAVAAGMVKILSSFASSGNNGMGTQLALGVQNISQYLSRDAGYIDSLRMLNDREFLSSMSCLMEVTTDGYCSTVDAQYLFQEITNSQSVHVKSFTDAKTGRVEKKIVGENKNFAAKLAAGPLAGYYILSRQVPVVTNWIQKVQYGITPQLPTEASFQTSVSSNVYLHYNLLKTIEGDFNFQRKLMGELTDFKSKQTYVLNLLNNVASTMTTVNPGSENFFLKVSSANEIYFRLLGMPVPDAVLGLNSRENMNFVNNPSGWLTTQYRTLPIFNDPDKLAEIISNNMQVLFGEATSMAISYYNKYFIVDKIQVVNNSLLGLDVNVRDALVNIDQYLANLTVRISKDSTDPTMIASILDTRVRISRILGRYDEIRNYSLQLLKDSANDPTFKNGTDPELNAKLLKIGESLLQEVYTQFMVIEARTGFLSNRMATFVYEDYTISLRHREQFGQYFEDLMLATGYDTLNTMTNMSQTMYSKIKTDLDQAMDIYKKSIDSLESVVSPVYIRNIFDLKLMAMNKEISKTERAELAHAYAYEMGGAQIPGEHSNKFQRFLRGHLKGAWMDFTGRDAQLLGAPGWVGKVVLPFEEMGNWFFGEKASIVDSPVGASDSAKGEMAKLCVQTLAFANLRPFWDLCKGTQLNSPFLKQDVTDADLKSLLNTYLSVNYVNKAYENIEPSKKNITGTDRANNYQARICALRDYHRRNEIARITAAMIDNGDTYAGMKNTSPPPPAVVPSRAATDPVPKGGVVAPEAN